MTFDTDEGMMIHGSDANNLGHLADAIESLENVVDSEPVLAQCAQMFVTLWQRAVIEWNLRVKQMKKDAKEKGGDK